MISNGSNGWLSEQIEYNDDICMHAASFYMTTGWFMLERHQAWSNKPESGWPWFFRPEATPPTKQATAAVAPIAGDLAVMGSLSG